MPKSRNRASHKAKANHFSHSLREQRDAIRRRDLRERLASFRSAGGLSLKAEESGTGYVQRSGLAQTDATAFDTVKG